MVIKRTVSGFLRQLRSWWPSSLLFELLMVRLMVLGSDAYIAYGTRAKEYLILLGGKF